MWATQKMAPSIIESHQNKFGFWDPFIHIRNKQGRGILGLLGFYQDEIKEIEEQTKTKDVFHINLDL